MTLLARVNVVETRVTRAEQDIAAIPARFDSLDKRLRNIELIVAGGMGALALVQIIIGMLT